MAVEFWDSIEDLPLVALVRGEQSTQECLGHVPATVQRTKRSVVDAEDGRTGFFETIRQWAHQRR